MQTNYAVELTGVTGVLLHNNNIEWRDQLEKFRKDPENKKAGKAGDDRSPAWSWIGHAYHDGSVFGVPSDNLMTCIRDGASLITVSGKKTFKAQSQSGLLVNEILWPILLKGKTIPWTPFAAMVGNPKFEEHQALAEKHGFTLFVKPCKVGKSTHIRVRPRFEKWTASGTITVFDDMITQPILEKILSQAGAYCGLCDWRPKSPSAPGQWGKFTATVKEI